MNTTDRIHLLQTTPFFGAISDDSVSLILGLSETLLLTNGEYFFHQGDPGDSLYLLEKGEISIFKTFNGKEYVLRCANAGDCFGELALIDFSPRGASVRCQANCTAIKIPSSALHSLYLKDMEQFLIIQMNIAREVSRRLRVSNDNWFQVQVANNSPATPSQDPLIHHSGQGQH